MSNGGKILETGGEFWVIEKIYSYSLKKIKFRKKIQKILEIEKWEKICHKYIFWGRDILQIWSSAFIGVKIVNLGSVIVRVKIEIR